MAQWRLRASLALAFACAGMGGGPVQSASSVSLQRDGALAIAGRALRCGGVHNVLDPHLPNLGVAAPGVLVLNPGLLSRQSEIVRLFVFHHECGHHHVGGNELKADCWAVTEGVKAGWLDREGLAQACRSFGDAPATPTHPSGARRCANLDRCFAVASQAKEHAGRQTPRPDLVATATSREAPKLVSGPTLVRSGSLR
ncbi:MAG TPA: hypothetical protein VLL28_10780 [Hyphomicrobiaceae bacterium]|nr:hypothetical protein [Hyphomicrobiaceae bacterium]